MATRLSSARTLSRAFRNKLDHAKLKKKEEEQKREEQLLTSSKCSFSSNEKSNKIVSQARINGLTDLLYVYPVDSAIFVERLQMVNARVNYLQQLLATKVFSNSIEITKAIAFVNELHSMHADYCQKARVLA